MVGPSPRYVNDDDYTGGSPAPTSRACSTRWRATCLGWSAQMAVIMGNPDRPELGEELTNSFCRTDPGVASQFARVTFLSDNRADLSAVTVPTLVLQCSDDVIAPEVVGRYVHEAIPGSVFTKLAATGHCPNLSAPEETTAAIRAFLAVSRPGTDPGMDRPGRSTGCSTRTRPISTRTHRWATCRPCPTAGS